MTQRIRLSLLYDDGSEYHSELSQPDHIDLKESTWGWLKDAFVAIGFSHKQVEDFFNDSTVQEGK